MSMPIVLAASQTRCVFKTLRLDAVRSVGSHNSTLSTSGRFSRYLPCKRCTGVVSEAIVSTQAERILITFLKISGRTVVCGMNILLSTPKYPREENVSNANKNRLEMCLKICEKKTLL